MAVIELERAASAAGLVAVTVTSSQGSRRPARLLRTVPGEALQRSAGDGVGKERSSDRDLLAGFRAATTPIDPKSFVD